MCAKFTRFDRMYSHQPAAKVQATQSRATGVNTSTLALTRNASNVALWSSTPPNIMFYADSVKPFLRFHLHGHSHASPYPRRAPRATGVNTSTLALTQCLQPGMAVINTPKHHVLRRFGQAIPPLPPAQSLARVSVYLYNCNEVIQYMPPGGSRTLCIIRI